jgi:hypothetical protein
MNFNRKRTAGLISHITEVSENLQNSILNYEVLSQGDHVAYGGVVTLKTNIEHCFAVLLELSQGVQTIKDMTDNQPLSEIMKVYEEAIDIPEKLTVKRYTLPQVYFYQLQGFFDGVGLDFAKEYVLLGPDSMQHNVNAIKNLLSDKRKRAA